MFVGLDIGGTKILGASCDGKGGIAKRTRADTPLALNTGLQLIKDLVNEVGGGSALRAIGISTGGPMNQKDGVVSPLHLPEWRQVPLKQILEGEFNCPCRIEVDTDAGVLAEYRFGGNKSRRLLYITISTGMGGGFLIDGEIYRGLNGEHPEVGHQAVRHNLVHLQDISCACGAKNCVEAIVSGTAIRRIYGKPASELSAAEWESVAFNLAEALRNLAVIYAPEVIVLGGGVTVGAGEKWVSRVGELVRKNVCIISAPRVEMSKLGYDTALYGALALALCA